MSKIIHAMSVCFTSSCHVRTVVPRLARSLGAHLPITEIEGVYLDNGDEEALIRASETREGQRWRGSRSARFFHRNYVWDLEWLDYPEPTRVSSVPVEAQLLVPVGRRALLRISFSTDIRRGEDFDIDTDMIVELLEDHARRLGQLLDTGAVARSAHRNKSGVVIEAREQQQGSTEIEVTAPIEGHTDMKVELLDDAITRCISAALHATQGQIYGDAGAAKLLGLKPSTLQSKMRKLGIERQTFVTQA